MEYRIDLSIIIVNYKNYTLTEKCINSVINNYKNKRYEIIVVDNNSPNESYEELTIKFKENSNVKIIKNKVNEGFGAANNLGVSMAKGEYVLLLNPDIIVLDDAIDKMILAIKNDSQIGLVSGKLLNDDYTLQYSCRRILSFKEFITARTPLSKLISNKKLKVINDKYLMKDVDHNSDLEVEWVMGACMLMKKSEFLQVGGFSKDYFMYFEDVDLCCKVRKCGKKVIYLSSANLIHLHNQESSKKLNKMSLIHLQSMVKFYKKYYINKSV